MKIFEGTVVSVSMKGSVSVEITRRTPHPLYKKLIRRSKKFLVDSNGLNLRVGDKVRIVETRPISKNKYFKVSEKIGEKQIINKKLNLKSDKAEETKISLPKRNAKKTIKKKEDK